MGILYANIVSMKHRGCYQARESNAHYARSHYDSFWPRII